MAFSYWSPKIYRCAAAEFTRPSDTTQYTAGDVVGPVTTPAVQTIARASRGAGNGGLIRNIEIAKSLTSITTWTVRVFFYNAAPTAIADNSAWTILYADRGKLIGYRDLDIGITGGTSGATAQLAATHTPLAFQTVLSSSLYVVIAAVGGYTPGSAETFSLVVTVEQF